MFRYNRLNEFAELGGSESHAPESCGCFRFFDKGKIICSVSDKSLPLPLEIAYKVARYEIIAAIRKESGEFDITQLEEYVNDIKTQLEMMRSIKRALTGASKNIKSAETDLKTMEDSIKQTLNEIWELLGEDEE